MRRDVIKGLGKEWDLKVEEEGNSPKGMTRTCLSFENKRF